RGGRHSHDGHRRAVGAFGGRHDHRLRRRAQAPRRGACAPSEVLSTVDRASAPAEPTCTVDRPRVAGGVAALFSRQGYAAISNWFHVTGQRNRLTTNPFDSSGRIIIQLTA